MMTLRMKHHWITTIHPEGIVLDVAQKKVQQPGESMILVLTQAQSTTIAMVPQANTYPATIIIMVTITMH